MTKDDQTAAHPRDRQMGPDAVEVEAPLLGANEHGKKCPDNPTIDWPQPTSDPALLFIDRSTPRPRRCEAGPRASLAHSSVAPSPNTRHTK